MVRFEGVAVGVAEGGGEFFAGVGRVVTDCLGGEIEAAGKGGVSGAAFGRLVWDSGLGLAVLERVLGGGGNFGKRRRGGYRTSQRRPSVATCFFVLSSFRTRDCSVSDSEGAASWRSRTFLYQSVSSWFF